MKKFLAVCLFVALLATIPSALAKPSLVIDSVDTSSWPTVDVKCTIFNLNQQQPAFSLQYDNQVYSSSETRAFESEGPRINVMFCVDISGSLDYNFPAMQTQLSKIAGLFTKNDTFSLVAFAENIEPLIKFSSNPAEAALQMGKLKAQGQISRINDAIIECNDLLHSRPDSEKGIIFLISDGNDIESINKPTKPDFPVVTVAPAGGIDIVYLRNLAQQTNGLFLPDFDTVKIVPFIGQIRGDLGNSYLVTFRSLPEAKPGSMVDLTLKCIVGPDVLEQKKQVEIKGSVNLLWVWVLLGILLVFALVFVLMWALRHKVKPGEKVVKKRKEGEVHYIAWINLYGSDTEHYRIRTSSVVLGTKKDADFMIDDETVSSEHARISETGDGFVIIDLKSDSGTFVNDKKINGSVLLKNGDTIVLGNTKIEFTQSDFAYVCKKKVI
ncbi:MAG: FHA domain-containing protein [Caldisericales bacterium]|nr:FHA domain-containing protein [Caldisericia bacterium]NMD13907.1 FHA domain-containing protein [Caldisericales bacterium]